ERAFDITKEVRASGVTVVTVEQNAFADLELSDRS
ncbi:MAG: ABC transporter ATP-binding protein, partial [Betaproteobacteria bacterium]|nr:ABC transporter ATP-binding protein [Betaproteobacteria bacterium]